MIDVICPRCNQEIQLEPEAYEHYEGEVVGYDCPKCGGEIVVYAEPTVVYTVCDN